MCYVPGEECVSRMPFIYAFVLSKINKRAVLDTDDRGQRPSHLPLCSSLGWKGMSCKEGGLFAYRVNAVTKGQLKLKFS